MSENKFKIDFDPPSPETLALAEKELRETPERVKESLEQLRKLMEGEPKLNFPNTDDFLMIFLRPCKFYPESALSLMKRVADFKKKYGNVLDDLTPEAEEDSMCNHGVVNVLVDRDAKGRRVLVANIGGKWDTKNVSGDQIFRLFYLIHLAAMREPETQIRGSVVILDFEGLGMKQVAQLTPAFSLRLLSFIQEAMPIRLKEVHIVKQPFIFNVVWNVFKPFIQEKLKSRLFFHGSKMSSLHKYMDPEGLPEDYGGKLPKIDYSSKDWYKVIVTLGEQVRAWQKFGWKE